MRLSICIYWAFIYLLCEVSFQIYCPFFLLFVILALTYKSSSYILGTSHLADMWIANIFYQSIACFLKILFIYLFYLFIFGCIGSLLLRWLSLVAASGGCSSLWCTSFSLWWLLLLQSHRIVGSRRAGFSSCGTQAQ